MNHERKNNKNRLTLVSKKKERKPRPMPVLPYLSSEQLLQLTREEFKVIAQKANIKPSALLHILRKDTKRQALAKKLRSEAPEPRYEAPAEERLMMSTVEYVFSELDFMSGPISLDLIDPMREAVEIKYLKKSVPRKGEELDRVIKNDKAMKELRRIYLLEVFSRVHTVGGAYDVFALATKAQEWLIEKRTRTNDPVDQAALDGALEIVKELPKKSSEYMHWFQLYKKYSDNHAYRNKTLDYETRYKVLGLFNDIRARARSGDSPYTKWMKFRIDDLVEIMAANYLRLRDVYISTWEGYTDPRGATGAAEWHAGGIGGQVGYGRGWASRPRRYSDDGSHGD